ncbi:hypothetical protein GCM10022206_23490 [Streptomyces chiangmaiensis]
MTAPDSLPLHALAEENLSAASPDLLCAMVKTFADALTSSASGPAPPDASRIRRSRSSVPNAVVLRGISKFHGSINVRALQPGVGSMQTPPSAQRKPRGAHSMRGAPRDGPFSHPTT